MLRSIKLSYGKGKASFILFVLAVIVSIVYVAIQVVNGKFDVRAVLQLIAMCCLCGSYCKFSSSTQFNLALICIMFEVAVIVRGIDTGCYILGELLLPIWFSFSSYLKLRNINSRRKTDD